MHQQLIGKTLGDRYQIVEHVGEGGMASVFKAYDLILQREVAVKIPADRFLSDPQFAQQFEDEMRLVARLKHPNVVAVYDAGQVQGRPYLIMEYMPYGSMAGLMQPGDQFPPPHVANIVGQIAAGLDHAHGAGLVHSDLKPGNILVESDGRVKLTDFGLAKVLNAASNGPVMGTPTYMAPEQILNQPLGPASDVYALGLIAHEMLAGRAAFEGDLTQVMGGQLYQAPPSVRLANQAVPPAAEQVILRALHKDPQQRFQRAGDFAAAFAAALQPERKPVFRPWMLPVAIAAVVLLLALAGFAGVRSFQASQQAALVATGDRAFEAGRVDEAIAGYEQALASNPNGLREVNRLILLYIMHNRYPEAEALARKTLEANPEALETRAWLAEALRVQYKFDDALAEAEAVVQGDPDLPMGYVARAVVRSDIAESRVEQASIDAAAADADKAVSLAGASGLRTSDPSLTRAMAYNARGLVYWNEYLLTSDKSLERSAITNGTEMFNRAVALVNLPLFRYNLGIFRLFEGRRLDEQLRRGDADEAFARARTEFEAALASDPSYLDARAGLGWLLFEQEEYAEAIKAFEAARPSDGRSIAPGPYVGLNFAYRNQPEPNFSAASEAIKQAIDLLPIVDDNISEYGWTYYEQDQYVEAEREFRRALELNPRNTDALVGLAYTFRDRDEPDFGQAITTLEGAIAIDPARARLHTYLGSTYLRQAREAEDAGEAERLYGRAEEIYARAIELDAEDAFTLIEKGWLLNDNARYDEAEATFRKAAELAPDSASAFIGLGWLYYYQEQYDRSEAAFRDGAAAEPDSADALNALGNSFYRRGLYQEAEAVYREALVVEPGSADIHDNLAWSLLNQDRYAEAELSYRDAVSYDAEYEGSYNGLGWSLYYQERYADAVEPYRKAIELDPEYANAMYGLGLCLEQLGQLDEARELFVKAVDLDAERSDYKAALDRLSE